MKRPLAAAHVIRGAAVPVEEPAGDRATNIGIAEPAVIEANRDFYDQIAQCYERYESCTFEPYFQHVLQMDLASIHSLVCDSKRTPHCLDCGGGTGNLALKMLAREWEVTVVDVSGEMLALLKEKARTSGYSPRLVQSPIERFLECTDETYHLVAFTSVLHHLYRYASVVQQAAAVVRPAGIFYSNYDPVVLQRPFWASVLNTLDITVRQGNAWSCRLAARGWSSSAKALCAGRSRLRSPTRKRGRSGRISRSQRRRRYRNLTALMHEPIQNPRTPTLSRGQDLDGPVLEQKIPTARKLQDYRAA